MDFGEWNILLFFFRASQTTKMDLELLNILAVVLRVSEWECDCVRSNICLTLDQGVPRKHWILQIW